MKTVIMAGGKGTRICSVSSNIPKPMFSIDGKPVLEHEIECLRDQGFVDLIITVSHLSSVITDYFGDGRQFGVRIQYFNEKHPLGNAGALFKLRSCLNSDFLLLNADVLFDIDFNRFVNFHREKAGLATLFTHPNNHPYDSGVIIADDNGVVQSWLAKEDPHPLWYANRVNAGLHVINPSILDLCGVIPAEIGTEVNGKIVRVDLDRQVLKPLCASGKIYCYDSPEYVKDMGTPDRYLSVCGDYAKGLVKAKNLRQKQKAIFLDRDGTINRYVGFLRNIEDFVLFPDVADGLKQINASGYLAIVVSNQPVIARGEVTTRQLREIHDKMETLLGVEGAYLDAIYYCPHHPHRGYKGEIEEFKIDCDCRKPKPGMLLKAAEDLNIDLKSSWMVGDTKNDIQAGKNAGCKTALIGTEYYGQDLTAKTFFEAIVQILA